MNRIINYREKYMFSISISGIFTLLLIFLPVFQQYKFFNLEFVDIFSLLFGIYGLIISFRHLNGKLFLPFYIYLVINVLLSSIVYEGYGLFSGLISSFRLIAIFFAFFISSQKLFKIEKGLDLYCNLVIVFSFIVLFQGLLGLIAHRYTFLIIPNTTLNYGGSMNSSTLIQSLNRSVNGGYIYRPSAFFIEPVFFVYYALPGLCISLIGDELLKKRKIWQSLIITLSIILTTSTMGIVCCSVIWILYFVRENRSADHNKNIRGIIAVLSIAFIILVAFNSENVIFSISRRINQLQNLDSASSTSLRILRGAAYFWEVDLFNKIFGCGFGKLTDYYVIKKMSLIYDVSNTNYSYMNSVFTILCSEGILGIILYFSSFIKLVFSKNYLLKTMSIVLLTTMFGGAIIDTGFYYLIIAIMICLYHNSLIRERN